MEKALKKLKQNLTGELHTSDTFKITYATDSSAYREMPLAVAIPKTKEDLASLISFARLHGTHLIPRTAGTSLAGQVVGSGIIVDVSQFFTSILELNVAEKFVWVEPGVIRDELNAFLKPHGYLFGPETSTSNRAMIGGMAGNNSCGSNSIVYGSTRENLLEVTGFLSDGSEVTFKSLSESEFNAKCQLPDSSLEGKIYRHIHQLLAQETKQKLITQNFPKPSITRRNTGYALDQLLDFIPFGGTSPTFNFCKLLAGSEGTLFFTTALKLKLTPLPPPVSGVVVAHFDNLQDALSANIVALQHHPYAVELMDHHILDCTIGHRQYEKYRFFLSGKPAAILAIQLHAPSVDDLKNQADKLIAHFTTEKLGYAFPTLTGTDVNKVWTLRKAGLGLLANIPGDAKAVPVIEDTCVDPKDLPQYISDFHKILTKRGLDCVHYAHAGSGELHLRPMINLKSAEGKALFKTIAADIAELVKQYNGSLSGEHGDGRLRGEFIAQMVGNELYQDFKDLKNLWDPQHIFNPNKIVDCPPMNEQLRYTPNQDPVHMNTAFDFSLHNGFLNTVEMCNGSADCRKTEVSGGIMCPSYMATRDELHTTRARANMLRELMTTRKQAAFTSPELAHSMELCLMCKGCKVECPSNVDMATYKSEYLHQKHQTSPPSFAQRKMGHFSNSMALGQKFSGLFWALKLPGVNTLVKKAMKIAPEREIPLPQKQSFYQWYLKHGENTRNELLKSFDKPVILFCDEFTNYLSPNIGMDAIKLLWKLGYDAQVLGTHESGRTAISKGFLEEATQIAHENVRYFSDNDIPQLPIIGIEPSTLLTFRDEYIQLLRGPEKERAQKLSSRCYLLDEFICKELDAKNISELQFTTESNQIAIHGHCHQKALGNPLDLKRALNIPKNYQATLIPSGCCGMAGAFGYENYDVSMKIGNLVLFPYINKNSKTITICATGTSCREQIKDGTQVDAKHLATILYRATL